MKMFLIYLLLVLTLISCSDDEPNNNVNIIGKLNVRMNSYSENGMRTHQFPVTKYLENTKIVLVNNSTVIEQTNPQKDDTTSMFYLLHKAEKNTNYKLIVFLNELLADTSNTFTINDNDIVYYSFDDFAKDFHYYPPWFKPCLYYKNFLDDGDTSLSFNLTQDTTKLFVFPNPATEKILLQFRLKNPRYVKIALYDFNLQFVEQIMDSGTIPPGLVEITHDVKSLAPGIYFVAVGFTDKIYYQTFMKK